MLRLNAHPLLHPILESLGYALGYLAYQRIRHRTGDVLNEQQRWSVIVAAAVGAMLGSRILGLLEQAPTIHIPWRQVFLPGGGKTIVGGLIGGWVGVEVVKVLQGIGKRTGDLFAIPLCIGIGVGRVGCLLAGLTDDTYGKPSSFPWAVDFGDGIGRHPTQAYEILFVTALSLLLMWLRKRPHVSGTIFRVFMAAYLAWRLLVDFLKPQPIIAGMSVIQWSCLFVILVMAAEFAFNRWRPSRAIMERRTQRAV